MSIDDKYTYPVSGGVLINSLGLRDAAALDEAVNRYASVELARLYRYPPQFQGFGTLQDIHRRLFKATVPRIAGVIRDVDTGAVGTGIAYCRPTFIRSSLDDLFGTLEREDYLQDLPLEEFSSKLADRWGYLTQIHPFRDGNTRAQSVFVTLFADRAGYRLNWERIDVAALRYLRIQAVVGSVVPLADYLLEHLQRIEDRSP